MGPVLAREKLIREREGSCGTPEAGRGTRWLGWRFALASEPEANDSATNGPALALGNAGSGQRNALAMLAVRTGE